MWGCGRMRVGLVCLQTASGDRASRLQQRGAWLRSRRGPSDRRLLYHAADDPQSKAASSVWAFLFLFLSKRQSRGVGVEMRLLGEQQRVEIWVEGSGSQKQEGRTMQHEIQSHIPHGGKRNKGGQRKGIL